MASPEMTAASLTLDNVKAVIRETEPEGSTRSSKKKAKVPVGAVASVWLVNRDFSLLSPVTKWDEVYPGIIISDKHLPFEKDELRRLGVTHMLNAAQGQKFSQIDTAAPYYADLGLQFMGIAAKDIAGFKLSDYFDAAADFIDQALTSGGKVVVHCYQGISRSASLVLAFLMKKQKMTLVQAIKTVRPKRGIMPNDGFIKQLIRLNTELYLPKPPSTADNDSAT